MYHFDGLTILRSELGCNEAKIESEYVSIEEHREPLALQLQRMHLADAFRTRADANRPYRGYEPHT